MKQLKTINLKGKEYVQVNERVLYFNETYPNGMFDTTPTFNGDTVYFKAVAIPDAKDKERYFVGHSFGSLKGEKALEKLETVAVGRALAFMGIGIVEGIASADEMEKFHNKQVSPTEVAPYCSVCGQVGIKGRFGWYCPDYKTHAKGQMVQKKNPLPPAEQKFMDELNIPIITE
jgi:hypothetical protein